jgi:hypothetical protein
MNCNFQRIVFVFVVLFFCTCKTPYTPAPITANSNYLVVEGLINITDSTFINLSRTVNVSAKTTVKPELKATVTIESNAGGSYPLKEVGNGVYAAAPLNLNPAIQYRLRIKTSNGNTYASDFSQTNITPPIDSVITDKQHDGIHIGVNTHNAQGTTRYYRWDYVETWQFATYYQSNYVSTGPAGLTVAPRTNDITHCWGNNISSNIILASTTGLSQDLLLNSPITYVPSNSEKLSIRYSILIRQYALTKEGYDYWTLLKKNTEQLGTIFDSQPSASIGNIHNVNNASEVVIGYINAGTVSQTRIYIDRTAMPISYVGDYVNSSPYNQYTCQLDTVKVAQRDKSGSIVAYPEQELFNTGYPLHELQIPIDLVETVNLVTLSGSHSGTSPICADCTLRGTNVKPAFWK